jgi:hypothetical protein
MLIASGQLLGKGSVFLAGCAGKLRWRLLLWPRRGESDGSFLEILDSGVPAC